MANLQCCSEKWRQKHLFVNFCIAANFIRALLREPPLWFYNQTREILRWSSRSCTMNVFSLDEETKTRIVVFLLKNIDNVKELRTKIIAGELDCCAIKPALIVNCFQIVIAANKAALSKKAGKLTTKSLNTELLFNLSTSKNITQSLQKFGIDDKDNHVVVVIFEEDNENKFEQMKSNFKGEICGIEEGIGDVNLIKKTYKISDKELEVSSLIDSVVSRISTKDFGSY